MPTTPLTIYCNASFPESATAALARGVGPHRLVVSPLARASNLAPGEPDPLLADADVAFGQPDPQQVVDTPRVKWVHLTTAGYTRYDTAAVRAALAARGGRLTNSSSVYSEPCAEHAFAFMLALARQLPAMAAEQVRDRAWRPAFHRANCRLLAGQSAILYGYGAIARRLAELLGPFGMDLVGVRRTVKGDETIRTVPTEDADAHLAAADHVFDVLPGSPATDGYFSAARFARMKAGATFYNIGRGTTVDQPALIAALEGGRLAGAYLDVTDPEPLPPDHPLWAAPNCWVTPHTAGGHADEFDRLAEHFLANLRRHDRGEPLADRVM
ncbi:MAG: putative 2-hydroxyacid dehydrogenase [Phycisphaerales bacterium]|nr:putative 2-hydroxyacid dehydrogenase [Phycisphaerales bacterium]